MDIFNEKEKLTQTIIELKKQNKTIGFVPTMGALHDGHMSLLNVSKAQNDYTIVSIFVNPTQFNNPDDLKKYPRTEEKDIELLIKNGCDFVYMPSVSDLYEENEKAKHYDFGTIDKVMEGSSRPGHFDGVATVVSKLFNIVQPTKAYFGEKDFQQIRIIQEMVKQEKLDVEIVPVSIYRAVSGLALSSRNARLSSKQLNDAPQIYEILSKAVALKSEGKDVAEIKHFVEKEFAQSPFELEYFEITNEETLLSIEHFEEAKNVRGFVVAYAGDIRLIDNIKF
ncbi:pantothenate synthetase [Chishuiella changwenlii]|uniref:Pantothenate synthetase n=1 Tax=Chishuiella changwenlii TaxID=1434701 RepID=A0A1M6YUZ9_9FLAO|nr:pantoate--beta-alanine ligase [Chishuiella changwenlii]GGE88160.1 pantothenate synthetase [Chishuiella changwenlii]SHL21902.1 pantothenate synthetase [Chishuiella changwenlii]